MDVVRCILGRDEGDIWPCRLSSGMAIHIRIANLLHKLLMSMILILLCHWMLVILVCRIDNRDKKLRQ